jgi:alpha-mannosidase
MGDFTDRDLTLFIKRFDVTLRDVLTPRICRAVATLQTAAWLSPDPKAPVPTPSEAAAFDFTPVHPGWRWGPKWSTAWFRIRGWVPSDLPLDTPPHPPAVRPHDPDLSGTGVSPVSEALGGTGVPPVSEALGGTGVPPVQNSPALTHTQLARPANLPPPPDAPRLALRFSSGTEAQVWTLTNNTWIPRQGLDVNRDIFELDTPLRPGDAVDLLIEAACNHPFGVTGFEWDDVEVHQRWSSPTPGRLERAEIALFDPAAWRLRHDFAFALNLLKELPRDSTRFLDLFIGLRRACEAMPFSADHDAPPNEDSARRSFARAQRVLDDLLTRPAPGSATRCLAVGHAHLDTAWLWPVRETKRKCLRTFSNQLRLMEQFPEYRFLCSQTQHYAWTEAASPELFSQIRARVLEGRWEPNGGMWVEPDANCPSGESLVRQLLHADRWWRSRFGDAGRQRFLYLPDTFGFPACLPQLMQLAGLDTFITNKLHWNTTTTFPHTTFRWRGMDGTEVLAHNTPGADYNASNTPKELRRGEANHRERDLTIPASPQNHNNNNIAVINTSTPPADERFWDHLTDAAARDTRTTLPHSQSTRGTGTPPVSEVFGGTGTPPVSEVFGGTGVPPVQNGPQPTRTQPVSASNNPIAPALRTLPPRWLQPFGFGDGGGGATDWSIHFARLAHNCEGLPRVQFSSASAFCDALAHDRAALRAIGEDFPLLSGEVYLEIHRGTLTTQAWLKKANRRAEDALKLAELLSFAPTPNTPTPNPAEIREARAELDAAWKLLLLNQFHDILPGSSINWVYEDSKHEFESISATTTKLITRGLQRWAASLPPSPLIVMNPAGTPRSGVVEVHADITSRAHTATPRLAYVQAIPALGIAATAESPAPGSVTCARTFLDNGIIRAEFDTNGRITNIRARNVPRGTFESANHKCAHDLVLYEDRPHMWDAWDIDRDYDRKKLIITNKPEIRIISDHPLRGAVEVERTIGAKSRIRQTYILDAGSPRLDIRTWVEWHESHTLLRAEIATDIQSREATYEIQFGHIMRPTHAESPGDAAKFENCVHRFIDVSKPGAGVAILNDSKYGASCRQDNNQHCVLGLSLLKSPKHPDAEADMGEHEFMYSIMPHAGDWHAAGVDREAEALNSPMIAWRGAGTAAGAWAPIEVTAFSGAGAAVDAVKIAEDDDALLVRFHESHGRPGRVRVKWNLPAGRVSRVDLLEREMAAETAALGLIDGETVVDVRAFEIVTLRADRGPA